MKLTLIEPYIIDANIFVEASRRYYSFDIAMPFWDGLVNFAQAGKILSIDRVYDEIMKGNDELKNWADDDFKDFFLDTKTKDILEHYSELVIWAQTELQYNQNAKNVFMEVTNADAWVLAYAKLNKCTIVTFEVGDYRTESRIPIPNVCDAFKIPYCDTFEMLKKLKFQF